MSVNFTISKGEKIIIIINNEKYFIENEGGSIKLKKCDQSSKCEEYCIPAIPPKLPSLKGKVSPEPPSVAPPPPPKVPPRYPYPERDDKMPSKK